MKTDQELKLELAKLLPKEIDIYGNDQVQYAIWHKGKAEVKDTEWLHVCWLVEQTLPIQLPAPPHQDSVRTRYVDLLKDECGNKGCCIASWQQRAAALVKVKKL